jgi:prevent-host-death family protein
MPSYSTSDLSRKSGDIIAEALRRPVTITQRNKPRLVLLNIEDYERLTRRAGDPRRVYRSGEEPAEIREELLATLDAVIDETDGT